MNEEPHPSDRVGLFRHPVRPWGDAPFCLLNDVHGVAAVILAAAEMPRR